MLPERPSHPLGPARSAEGAELEPAGKRQRTAGVAPAAEEGEELGSDDSDDEEGDEDGEGPCLQALLCVVHRHSFSSEARACSSLRGGFLGCSLLPAQARLFRGWVCPVAASLLAVASHAGLRNEQGRGHVPACLSCTPRPCTPSAPCTPSLQQPRRRR